MQVTKEQREIIKSFSCERLSKNEANKAIIERFASIKGKALVDYLKSHAWDEDRDGSTAYYLLKTPDGEAALFFSLKCGSLFKPMDEDAILSAVEHDQDMIRILGEAIQHEDQEEGRKIAEILRSSNMDPMLLKRLLVHRIKKKRAILNGLEEDRQRELNRQIVQVSNTYSGIELFHFCADDRSRNAWRKYNIDHPFGEVMFWQYVVPKICRIQKLVGCQYVYLFAADLSEDETLIRYYESLNFKQSDDLATNKPLYDLYCRFMHQPINELPAKRRQFFGNFNPRKGDLV